MHCHFSHRDLNSFRIRAENLVSLCKRVFPDKSPEILNIGGGFFSELPESISSRLSTPHASFAEYGETVGRIFAQAFPSCLDSPTLLLEPGTSIVANILDFYTRVISTKSIRGKYFATVAGSIFDISPNDKIKYLPVSPIYNPHSERGPSRNYAVVGFTCIEGDILTESLVSPLSTGDALVYGNVGSYSVVMRPPFILPSNPMLMMNPHDGNFVLIKSKQSNEDVFNLFDL